MGEGFVGRQNKAYNRSRTAKTQTSQHRHQRSTRPCASLTLKVLGWEALRRVRPVRKNPEELQRDQSYNEIRRAYPTHHQRPFQHIAGSDSIRHYTQSATKHTHAHAHAHAHISRGLRSRSTTRYFISTSIIQPHYLPKPPGGPKHPRLDITARDQCISTNESATIIRSRYR